MIHNIVPLPVRQLTGEVSTIQPLFRRKEALEDTYGFGCSYDLVAFSGMHKYKTIERFGDHLIERIIYSDDPVLGIKKWWTASIPLFPVWSKMYEIPFKPRADVYRYLEGSAQLASRGCIEHPLTQTIFTPVWNEMSSLGLDDMVEPEIVDLSRYVVPGDDNTSMVAYSTTKDMLADLRESRDFEYFDYNFNGFNFAPHFEYDPYHPLFGKSLVASDLKPLLSPHFVQSPIPEIKDPFEITPMVGSDYNTELASWTIQDLMYSLESSGYTDIRMHFDRRINKVTSDMYNGYLGMSPVYTDQKWIEEKNHLINVFMRYANVIISSYPNPVAVTVIKNWYEEVFIIVHINDKEDDKYLFDLSALSIGSPAFTDING